MSRIRASNHGSTETQAPTDAAVTRPPDLPPRNFSMGDCPAYMPTHGLSAGATEGGGDSQSELYFTVV